MPCGVTAVWHLNTTEFIVDTSSPMVQGVPNPFTGNFGNHANHTGLPANAHVVVVESAAGGPSTLYDLRPVQCGTPTPTPTATRTPTPTPTATRTPTPTPTATAT